MQNAHAAEVAAYNTAGMRAKRRHGGATASAAAIWGGFAPSMPLL